MKKNLLVISLIFAMCCSAFAQEAQTENTNENADVKNVATSTFCPHRINIYGGVGYTNNIYRRINLKQYYSISELLSLHYAYFFNEHWGLSIGAELNHVGAKALFAGEGVLPQYADHLFNNDVTFYDLYWKADGLKERQSIWAIEVPLMAQFEWIFDGRSGIYAGLGIYGYFPFLKGKNVFWGEGAINTWGVEDPLWQDYNVDYPMDNHFNGGIYDGKDVRSKLKCSFGAEADFGGVFRISRVADGYVGAFCKVNFLDILPKNKLDVFTDNNGEPTFNGTLASNILETYKNTYPEYSKIRTKWDQVQVGLKLGVHIKCCANPVEMTKRQIQKEMLEEMKKKKNEPIIIKQDPQYIYIVPQCDLLDNDDEDLSPRDKKAIRELQDELSRTKILFDLDKDIPKIQDVNDNINRCVAILKDNPKLALEVEGYTCDLGSEEHNRDLAQRRANKVRDLFIQKGVHPEQIRTVSYTVNDPENRQNIQDPRREEHRAAIFRIVKR
ncbi:MAG: OmpA family protein [Bacteroidales bacterium]|nr:OmpA family protein [Bacteroidales bacterium]